MTSLFAFLDVAAARLRVPGAMHPRLGGLEGPFTSLVRMRAVYERGKAEEDKGLDEG